MLGVQLLMYIVLLGLRLGYEFDLIRVHDRCIGADSVCFDQYCSCMIGKVYFDELGSFRMLCVHDWFCGGCIARLLWCWCWCLLSF